MKRLFLLFVLFVSAATSGQPGRLQPPQSKKIPVYTLSGQRNGVSFFPETRFKDVRYETGDTLIFNKYHSADVIYDWPKTWADKYPDLIDMYGVGRSFEGRPIIQITLTNKKTGKDTDKPAAFFEGGRHSGEIAGLECILWMIKYLIENYGKDPDVLK